METHIPVIEKALVGQVDDLVSAQAARFAWQRNVDGLLLALLLVWN